MPKYNVVDEGVVEAEPMVVFKAVMDELAGVTHWSPPNVTYKLRGDAPLRQGVVFDSTIKAKGLTTNFGHKVIEIVEGKSIEYDVTGDALGTGKWIFELEEEKTKVRFLFDFRTNKLLRLFYLHLWILEKGIQTLCSHYSRHATVTSAINRI